MEFKYQTWTQIVVQNQDVYFAGKRNALDFDIGLAFPSGVMTFHTVPPHTQISNLLSKGDPTLELVYNKGVIEHSGDLKVTLCIFELSFLNKDANAKKNLGDLSKEVENLTNQVTVKVKVAEKFEYKDPVRARFENMIGSMNTVFGMYTKLMILTPDAHKKYAPKLESYLRYLVL